MSAKHEYKEHLYIQIARSLEYLINKGLYKGGDKLPSVRKMMQEKNLSMSTVLQAYTYLESKGKITSREKSGYFVSELSSRKSHSGESSSSLLENEVKINSLIVELMPVKRDNNFISFSRALPDSRLLPLKLIKKTYREVLRNDKIDFLQYEDAKGNLELRKQIARQAFRWGGMIDHDDVVITNGALEAIYLCLKAVAKPGDTIVVEAPCYYGVLQILENLSLKVLEIPEDINRGINITRLRKVIKEFDVRACVFVPNFNNPTGLLMEDFKKEQIAELANELKIPVIEDDIYGELYFGNERPKTIKSFDKQGWVMLCSSFSKNLAPGMRIGWAIPGRFAKKVEEIKFMTNICCSNIDQQVLSRILEGGLYDRFLKKYRLEIYNNITRSRKLIQENFPHGTKVSEPRGGMVLWIELPDGRDSVSIQKIAMENNIGITPGLLFSSKGSYRNFIRFSCGNYWDQNIIRAIKQLAKIV